MKSIEFVQPKIASKEGYCSNIKVALMVVYKIDCGIRYAART